MEEQNQKEYYFTDSRFRWISLLLFLMFVIFMVFLYLKAEEITHNACQVCARQLGTNVVCQIIGQTPIEEMIFYPNFTITERTLGG